MLSLDPLPYDRPIACKISWEVLIGLDLVQNFLWLPGRWAYPDPRSPVDSQDLSDDSQSLCQKGSSSGLSAQPGNFFQYCSRIEQCLAMSSIPSGSAYNNS